MHKCGDPDCDRCFVPLRPGDRPAALKTVAVAAAPAPKRAAERVFVEDEVLALKRRIIREAERIVLQRYTQEVGDLIAVMLKETRNGL